MRLCTNVTIVLVLLGGCRSDSTGPKLQLSGSYTAVTFFVTPVNQSKIDVLNAGGSLSIVISESGSTAGTLLIPAVLTGVTTETTSMSGKAHQSGTKVHFEQAADSFVRDLEWDLTTTGLQVVNQSVGSATFTITLSRQ